MSGRLFLRSMGFRWRGRGQKEKVESDLKRKPIPTCIRQKSLLWQQSTTSSILTLFCAYLGDQRISITISKRQSTMQDNDIAIVGFSFKLPQGVEDVESFWDVLETRKNLMTDWPESRINVGSIKSNVYNKVLCILVPIP